MKKIVLLFVSLLFCLNVFAADWTVYVHMNGDNNLCSFAKKDLQELVVSSNLENANVFVGFDCSRYGDSVLYKVEKSGPVKSSLVPAGEWDMGNSDFMANTANKVFSTYPSKYKMMVVWNHGSGVYGQALVGPHIDEEEYLGDKNISYDDQSGSEISIIDLGQAMSKIGHVDVLGFDACLMQMIEIGYEVSPYSNYMVGSEDLEPGNGWNYSKLNWSFNPKQLSMSIPVDYLASYPTGDVTLSTVDLKKLEELVGAMDQKFDKFASIPNLKSTLATLPKWDDAGSVDLGALLTIVGDEDLIQLYKETVLIHKASEESTGLAIQRNAGMSQQYPQLRFSKDFNWLSLIK